MDIIQADARLRRIIETGARHKNYEKAKAFEEIAEIIFADKPSEVYDHMRRYRPNEDEAISRQRVNLSNPQTSAIIAPISAMLTHIKRAKSGGLDVTITHPDEELKNQVERKFENFYEGLTLVDYLYEAAKYANLRDPNMWVGFERQNYEDNGVTNARVYPVEFSSEQAYDFGLNNFGDTVYLCAGIHYKESTTDGKDVSVESIWFYGAGFIIRAVYNAQPIIHTQVDPSDGWNSIIYTVKGKPESWLYKIVENDAQEVPFFRPGAFQYERKQIKQLMYQDALGLLYDYLRDTVYLSAQKTLHVFPNRAEYVRPCNYQDEQGQPCINGRIGEGEEMHQCGQCQGTGRMQARSESDVITMRFDEGMSADQMLDLAKLVHYFNVDIKPTEFFVRELDRIAKLVFAVTFNQNDTAPHLAVERTATEVTFQADQINNVLSSIGEAIERGIEKAYRLAFQYVGRAKDSDVSAKYGQDFKVIPLDQVLATYGQAVAVNAPGEVIEKLQMTLIEMQYPDDSLTRNDILAMFAYKPFATLTPEAAAQVIADRAADDPDKLLYENWTVFCRILKADLNGLHFSKLTEQEQQRRVDMALEMVKARIRVMSAPVVDFGA